MVIPSMPDQNSSIKIDATLTFSPGNEVLLTYLLSEMKKRRLSVKVHVRHKLIFERLVALNLAGVSINKTSIFGMLKRMLRRNQAYLYFCSIPPISNQPNSIVYYHASDLLDPVDWADRSVGIVRKLKRWLMITHIQTFHQKASFFACQTDLVQQRLRAKYPGIRTELLPFYEPAANVTEANLSGEHEFQAFDFFYPATADAHKNLFRLFGAVRIAGRHKKITLGVTIPAHFFKYIERMLAVNLELGYDAIVNVGRITRAETIHYLIASRALIFPSLEESLGLPIIEAAELGKPIIIADRPYAHAILDEPMVFDPLSIKSMAEAMLTAHESIDILKAGKARMPNETEKFINLLALLGS